MENGHECHLPAPQESLQSEHVTVSTVLVPSHAEFLYFPAPHVAMHGMHCTASSVESPANRPWLFSISRMESARRLQTTQSNNRVLTEDNIQEASYPCMLANDIPVHAMMPKP